MPLIKLQMSPAFSEVIKNELCLKLSKICAECLSKPEAVVASLVEDDAIIAFGGEMQSGAYVEVKSIGGLNNEVNTAMSKAICECIEEATEIPGARIYINFSDIPRDSWGWQSKTFA